ncbi:MAG TPA: hypothetical protein VFF09_05450 [archaeon]|nr:hypothetical protein [archaeon]
MVKEETAIEMASRRRKELETQLKRELSNEELLELRQSVVRFFAAKNRARRTVERARPLNRRK